MPAEDYQLEGPGVPFPSGPAEFEFEVEDVEEWETAYCDQPPFSVTAIMVERFETREAYESHCRRFRHHRHRHHHKKRRTISGSAAQIA